MRTTFKIFVGLALLGTIHARAQNKPTLDTKVPLPTTAVPVYTPAAYANGTLVNFVRSRTAQQPFANEADVNNATRTPEQVQQGTEYFDGLGRGVQSVGWQASPNKADMVAPMVYDALGRQVHSFLPYAAATNTGTFKANPFVEQQNFYSSQYPAEQPAFNNEQYYYGKTIIEPSPLNRPIKTLAAGNSWMGSEGAANEKAVQMQYLVNDVNDVVRVWQVGYDVIGNTSNIPTSGTTYNPGELYKSVTIDEAGNKVIEYKDKEGNAILKKVQVDASPSTNHSGWLCTYYVYDDFNHLRFVIPPLAVAPMNTSGNWALTQTAVDELCYRYEYDGRNRMIAKKVPGAGWIYMVYDNRDRLAFSQDANMRGKSPNQWLYVFYDALNRPVQTGMMQYNGTRDDLQNYLSALPESNTTITTTGSLPNANPADLAINQRQVGRTSYQASNSIAFDNEFISEDGADFVAEIFPSLGSETVTTTQDVNNQPQPPGANFIPLTLTYYNNYTWTNKTYNNSNNSKLDQGSNAYAVPLPAQNSSAIKGHITGIRVRVLEDANNLSIGNWLESVNFYDDEYRLVQSQTTNYKGGGDITTMRYDFSGKVVCTYAVHNNAHGAIANLRVKTNMDYDHAGRLLRVVKRLNDDPTTDRLIVRNTYDALGQLKRKEIGQKTATDITALETQDHQQNIRGWLKGINWDYTASASGTKAKANRWFAMDLSYDWGFTTNQSNGNIAGTRWTTLGSGEERAYGFAYDPVNRLMKGDFTQHNGGNWDVSTGIDFSMKMGDGVNAASAYDENGNIKRMQHWGFKLGVAGTNSPQIDDLNYSYFTNTNKLAAVTDVSTGGTLPTVTGRGLGDFIDKNTTGNDYAYDVNGNLLSDKNKRLNGNGSTGIDLPSNAGAIEYNHLNLPWRITVKDDAGNSKGTITYIYDATGNKLEKRVDELPAAYNQNQGKQNPTTYLTGFVYQNNALSFFGQEEGRIRPGKTPEIPFVFDYFLRDHLGNTRVVLTDEQQTDSYPAATMELAASATENTLYDNIDASRYTSVPAAYPGDPVYPNSAALAKLNGNGQRIGPAKLLKVMAGDKINIRAVSWWEAPGGTTNGLPVSPLPDLINALTGGLGNLPGTKANPADIGSSGVLGNNNISQFLSNQPDPGATKPRAFVNWILLDEQFRYVATGSNADPVDDNGVLKQHLLNGLPITKSGYLYIYTSNETPNINVFFDNLQVTHVRGPLLDETHYYPFGLTMSGISFKAAGVLENKRKFNKGSELQNNEFSDGSGLELYATNFRSLDPQLGRWWQLDPKPTLSESLYASMGNNPISNNDPLGDVIKGVSKESAERELALIKGTFTGKEAAGLNKLFKLKGNTFKRISDKKFDKAISKLSPEQQALAKGYKEVINSKEVHNVEVVKQSENLSALSQKTFGMQTGKQINDIAGGGVSTWIPGSDPKNNFTNERVEVIVMDPTNPFSVKDRATGVNSTMIPTAGMISAHEILGHQLASIKGSVNASALNSVQVDNLYLRSQGITNSYRTDHVGIPFSESKVELTPDYLK